MGFVEPAIALAQDEFSVSSVATCRLGTRAITRDGRVFRYCQAGPVELSPGTIVQSGLTIAGHMDVAATMAPLGATTFLMNPMGAAGAANLYAEGYFGGTIEPGSGVGGGYVHVIAQHAPISTTAPWSITLETPLVVANPSRVGLIQHPYKGVVLTPVPPTAKVVGVPTNVIPAGQYGWLLTWGITTISKAVPHGDLALVMASALTAGSVDGWFTTGGVMREQVLGMWAEPVVAGPAAKRAFVFVTIAP